MFLANFEFIIQFFARDVRLDHKPIATYKENLKIFTQLFFKVKTNDNVSEIPER